MFTLNSFPKTPIIMVRPPCLLLAKTLMKSIKIINEIDSIH